MEKRIEKGVLPGYYVPGRGRSGRALYVSLKYLPAKAAKRAQDRGLLRELDLVDCYIKERKPDIKSDIFESNTAYGGQLSFKITPKPFQAVYVITLVTGVLAFAVIYRFMNVPFVNNPGSKGRLFTTYVYID